MSLTVHSAQVMPNRKRGNSWWHNELLWQPFGDLLAAIATVNAR
jgi:hypothetical protein